MKPAKTLIMMIAAAVTTRAPWRKPVITASRGSGAVDVLLAHPGDQEDLVVHGQAEHDADQEDGQQADDGRGCSTPEQVGEPAPLEDRDDGAEGGDDAEQEAEGRLQRHQQRPEDQHQQQEGQPDDDQQVGQQRVAELARDVDVDGGQTGDADAGCRSWRGWPARRSRMAGTRWTVVGRCSGRWPG